MQKAKKPEKAASAAPTKQPTASASAPKTAKKAAKTTKKAKNAPPPVARKSYSDDLKAEARDLYLRGVGLDRIARYLDVPPRTLTNWQTENKWTEQKDPSSAAFELKKRGYKIDDIAARLGISKRTVGNLLKSARTAERV